MQSHTQPPKKLSSSVTVTQTGRPSTGTPVYTLPNATTSTATTPVRVAQCPLISTTKTNMPHTPNVPRSRAPRQHAACDWTRATCKHPRTSSSSPPPDETKQKWHQSKQDCPNTGTQFTYHRTLHPTRDHLHTRAELLHSAKTAGVMQSGNRHRHIRTSQYQPPCQPPCAIGAHYQQSSELP